MREIEPLTESTADEAVRILRNAYPVADLPSVEKHRNMVLKSIEQDNVHIWTVHEQGQMLGTLRTHDFVMNAFGLQIPVQGLGGVAVDLCHKKKKVARDLVKWYIERSYDLGAGLAALYPFRMSFYDRMGWGSGTPMHRFHLKPASFPETPSSGFARFLQEEDIPALSTYLDRVQSQTHGLFKVDRGDVKVPKPEASPRTVGIMIDGRIEAHVVFQFVAINENNMLAQDIEVLNWTYSTTRGLHGLFQFFRQQADQVNRVVFMTQDSHLQRLFADPVDGSDNNFHLNHQISERGSGVMYRMVDPALLFGQLAEHDFGGVDMTCGIDLQDGFWERTSGSFDLVLEGGRARVVDGPAQNKDRLKIGVGDFTSVLLGAVPIRRLLEYGKATLEGSADETTLERAFDAREAPRCTTRF